jgi:hypothetical protein
VHAAFAFVSPVCKDDFVESQLPTDGRRRHFRLKEISLFKTTFAIALSGLLLITSAGFQSALAQTDETSAGKARAKVQQMGVGRDARVEVKLRNNTKVKGYIGTANEDSFTVTDMKTGATQTVAYVDVTEVKKPGGGLSPRAWMILGGVAAAAVIVGVTVIRPIACDGGAGC